MRCIIALLVISLTAPVLQADVRVIDGDTLEIGSFTYRLQGIDAPEYRQFCVDAHGSQWPCGRFAKLELMRLLQRGDLRCLARSKDRYGRIIATCFAGNLDLGAALVSTGTAWAYLQFSRSYQSQQAGAINAQVGVWQAPNLPPWEYRRQLEQ